LNQWLKNLKIKRKTKISFERNLVIIDQVFVFLIN
jgi:hypothetical protein